MNLYPGVGGWAETLEGGWAYHIATVAGGHRAGYVTLNDADEWIAGVYDRSGDSHVIGSGYSSLHEAKMAVDAARDSGGFNPAAFPGDYKLKMIRAYPTIAQMDADELFFSTFEEREEAFRRLLACKNLRAVHESLLDDLKDVRR